MDQNQNTTATPTKKSAGKTFADTTAQTAGVVIGVYAGLFIVGTARTLFKKFNQQTPSDTTEE